jgi:putative salt-induced outer membrane protein YdiY
MARCIQPLFLLLLAVVWMRPAASAATPVVVQLRNGDRLTGELLAQETNHIVLQTGWAGVMSVPIDLIGGLRTTSGADLLPPPAKPPEAKPVAKLPAKPAVPAAPPSRWRNNFQLGINFNSGARDQELFYTRIKSSYTHPYLYQPTKSFRSILDFSADYGETDDKRSANKMNGSWKADFDIGDRTYCYNEIRGGYDEVRKIDGQYGFGPGLGYHLIRTPKFALNVEGGLDYQYQDRSDGVEVEDTYYRAGQDLTWKITPRLSFIEKFDFYLNSSDSENFRFRLDATASYKLVENLSLNLSVLNLYDTDPAPKVDKNELQVRSTVGIAF